MSTQPRRTSSRFGFTRKPVGRVSVAALHQTAARVVDTLHMGSGETSPDEARNSWLAQGRHEALQRELEECTRERARLERLCVGGIVAAFVYIAQNADVYVGTTNYVWFVPVLLAVFGALKSFALDTRMRNLGQCLQVLEAQVDPLQPALLPRWSGVTSRRWPARAAWLALVALTVFASLTGFETAWVQDDDDEGEADEATANVSVQAPTEPVGTVIRIPASRFSGTL